MYLRRFQIRNIRSIKDLTLSFAAGHEAGWHVILGPNGAGKSSVVRSFALLMMGEKEAYASRQDFSRWMRDTGEDAVIEATMASDEIDVLSGADGRPSGRYYRE